MSATIEDVIVLAVHVPGRPRTKGSMRIVNSRTKVLEESVAGSVRWRQLVAYQVERERRSGWPYSGPVGVELSFGLPVDPIEVQAGDIDKLTRNILDALSYCSDRCSRPCRNHAGVYVDDVQVCSLVVTKAGPVPNPGVVITVKIPGP